MGERKLILSVRLEDCEVQTFRCGGAGGQHRDKTSNGVRVIHRESGATGQSTEDRSQLKNKRTAFKRMVESDKFQLWIKVTTGQDLVQEAELNRRVNNKVDRDMHPDNILIEYLGKDENE